MRQTRIQFIPEANNQADHTSQCQRGTNNLQNKSGGFHKEFLPSAVFRQRPEAYLP